MVELDTDSDSSHPEIISLSSSASVAREHHRAQRTFHASEKRKAKEKNRRHDERFKAQAEMRQRTTVTREIHQVGDHKVVLGNIPSEEQRMKGDGMESDASESETGEEWGGISIDKFPVMAEELEDVEMLKGEDSGKETRNGDFELGGMEGGDDDLQSISSKYLPDHIFLTALSKPKTRNDVRPSQATPKTRPARKRQGVHARAKDVAVGTRTVRTLSSSPVTALAPLPRTTLPPARVKKFLANALALPGASKRAQNFPLDGSVGHLTLV